MHFDLPHCTGQRIDGRMRPYDGCRAAAEEVVMAAAAAAGVAVVGGDGGRDGGAGCWLLAVLFFFAVELELAGYLCAASQLCWSGRVPGCEHE